jgi:phage-related minor tail protein
MSLSLLKHQLNHKSMSERMFTHLAAQNIQEAKAAVPVKLRQSKAEHRKVANEKNKELMLLRKTKTISKDRHKKLESAHAKKQTSKSTKIEDFKSSLQIL